MKYTEDAYSECPFYIKESDCSIVCEGLYNGTKNHTVFCEDKAEFKDRFCKNKYRSCRLYRALALKHYD
ncbi:MAG: hypothetical protein E7591_00515 [Ruminococcaceae bacterium]|nr:hypothetical protein [Oscillospiraceae bacterium]